MTAEEIASEQVKWWERNGFFPCQALDALGIPHGGAACWDEVRHHVARLSTEASRGRRYKAAA